MMRHMNRFFIICVLAALGGCEQPQDHPLIGTWEAIDPFDGVPDASGFGGTWLFKKDKDYRLDILTATFGGPIYGYSSGHYKLLSDSILVLNILEYKNFPVESWDTLHIELTETEFITQSLTDNGIRYRWIKD